jgi:hypothetical protein
VILAEHLLVRSTDIGIGPAHPPEILGELADISAPNPLPDPGREVDARNAAGRIVVPRETGKIAVTASGRVAQ